MASWLQLDILAMRNHYCDVTVSLLMFAIMRWRVNENLSCSTPYYSEFLY